MEKSTLNQKDAANIQGGFNSGTTRFMYFHHFFSIKPEDKLKSETLNSEEMEWLVMRGMSTGTVTLSKIDKKGVVSEESGLDFGVPSGNKFGVSTAWETKNIATPLGDLEQLAVMARNNGVTLKYFVMRRSDFIDLRNADEVTTKIKAWVNTKGNLLVTKDTINQFLTANELPTIVVVDPSVRFYHKDHTYTKFNPWQRYRVVGIPCLEIGEITITEDNLSPTLNNPESLYYMRTDSARWDS